MSREQASNTAAPLLHRIYSICSTTESIEFNTLRQYQVGPPNSVKSDKFPIHIFLYSNFTRKIILVHTVCAEAEFLSLKSFRPCYSQPPLPPFFTPPPPPPQQEWFETGLYFVNIVPGKSENYQDYAQKPQRNCTFMNSISVRGNRKRTKMKEQEKGK